MRLISQLVSAIAMAGAFGCALNAQSADPEQGGTAGGGAASAGSPVVGSSELRAASTPLHSTLSSPTFATLRRDYTVPNWINPTLRADEWVCGLGKVQGNMQDGGGGGVKTYVDGNGEWALTGYSFGAQVIAGANCVTVNQFSGRIPDGALDTNRWLSGDILRWDAVNSCSAFTGRSDAWWGDAATFLTGMEGGFYGGGESVNVDQSNDPWNPSYLYPTLCQGDVWVWGRSLFVGAPNSGRQAKFRGPNGVGGAAEAGEYSVDRGFIWMAPLSEAFCYFTGIRGAFAGGGETAEIVIATDQSGTETWAMRTNSGQGLLRANARCFLFDQTW